MRGRRVGMKLVNEIEIVGLVGIGTGMGTERENDLREMEMIEEIGIDREKDDVLDHETEMNVIDHDLVLLVEMIVTTLLHLLVDLPPRTNRSQSLDHNQQKNTCPYPRVIHSLLLTTNRTGTGWNVKGFQLGMLNLPIRVEGIRRRVRGIEVAAVVRVGERVMVRGIEVDIRVRRVGQGVGKEGGEVRLWARIWNCEFHPCWVFECLVR